MRVVVLEAGIDYVEQLESFDLDGVSGPQALDGALAAVAAKGYRIMHNSEGGCCEHCSVSVSIRGNGLRSSYRLPRQKGGCENV